MDDGKLQTTSHLRFFRWWSGLVLLVTLALGPPVVFTFGAASFSVLFLLWLREPRKPPEERLLDRLNGATLLISVLWFVLNLAIELMVANAAQPRLEFYLPLMALAFAYPPLILHSSYLEHRAYLPPSPLFEWAIRLTWPLSAGFIGAATMIEIGFFRRNVDLNVMLLQSAMFAFFLVTLALSLTIGAKSRKRLHFDQRMLRRWMTVLIALSLSIFLIIIVFMAMWSGGERIALYLGMVSRCLPLCFFFVGTYYENRFTFFDIFVKRGTFFFFVIIFLVAYFTWVPPLIEAVRLRPIARWAFVLTLLPFFMLLPWLYQKLEIWLDRAWLGRTFSNIEAVKFFLGGVRNATTEAELVRQAEVWLRAIFQAEASVALDPEAPDAAAPFPIRQQASIRSQGRTIGTIRLGRRTNDTPYFSSDLALLASLTEVFASLLENARMQKKKQEQEQREQELMLHASRSELKALRAQINPHFLFNALNVIAGLIHKDPTRAEETIEELAEVFRYTLKRSEKESVRLEDEVDFVRAYLQIEKARFGQRLQVCVDVDPDVRCAVIPTMMIQTLVENAVKHGVASIRGTGLLQIRARRCEEQLRVQVADNGPGFELEAAVTAPASRSGYGLRNLIERLGGHFGAGARLSVERAAAPYTTVVTVEMPLTTGAA